MHLLPRNGRDTDRRDVESQLLPLPHLGIVREGFIQGSDQCTELLQITKVPKIWLTHLAQHQGQRILLQVHT